MSKKETSKHADATSHEVEEKPSPHEEPKTQDKSPQEDDEQEGRIPLEEMSSRQIGEKGEEIAAKYLMYAALHPALTSIRFDVVAINLVAPSTASLRHLIGAFSWDEQ